MIGRTVISQSHENAVWDESLSRVGARFLPVASWDDLLRDERGMPHGQVFALDCTFVGRTCMVDRLGRVLDPAFGPFSTFPESCVPDGPFRGRFGARSGPFSTIEWGTCG